MNTAFFLKHPGAASTSNGGGLAAIDQQMKASQQQTANTATFAHTQRKNSSRVGADAYLASPAAADEQLILNKDSEIEFSNHQFQPASANASANNPTAFSAESNGQNQRGGNTQQQNLAGQALSLPAEIGEQPPHAVTQPQSSFRRRMMEQGAMGDPKMMQAHAAPPFTGGHASSGGASSMQHHSISYASNPMGFTAPDSKKPLTLKARMRATMRQHSTQVQTQPTLTKQELKELKRLNEKREMFTLLERTSGPNTHLKYLTGRSRLMSAAGGGAFSTAQRSRSGSRASQRIKSAHSRKTSSSGEHTFMQLTKKARLNRAGKTQQQSLRLFQSYATAQSTKHLKGQLKQNYEAIIKRNRSKRNVMTKLIEPLSRSAIQHAGLSTKMTNMSQAQEVLTSNDMFRSHNKLNSNDHKLMTSSISKHPGNTASETQTFKQKRVKQRIQSAQSYSRAQRRRQVGSGECNSKFNHGSTTNQMNTTPPSPPAASVKPKQAAGVDSENDKNTLPGSSNLQNYHSTLQPPNSTSVGGGNPLNIVQYSSISNAEPLPCRERPIQSNEMVIPLGTTSTWVQDEGGQQPLGKAELFDNQRRFSNTQDPTLQAVLGQSMHNSHLYTQNDLSLINNNQQQSQLQRLEDCQHYQTLSKEVTIGMDQGMPTASGHSTIDDYNMSNANRSQHSKQKQIKYSIGGKKTMNTRNQLITSAKMAGPGQKFKTMQDIYDINAVNTSNAKSSSPHKAPQYRITELKNHIANVQNNALKIKAEIEETDTRYKKINNNSKYTNQQTFQCEADKLEVLRDISQYEYNYSQQVLPIQEDFSQFTGLLIKKKSQDKSFQSALQMTGSFKEKMQQMLLVVKKHRKMCRMACEFDDYGNTFFTNKSHAYDFMNLNFNQLLDSSTEIKGIYNNISKVKQNKNQQHKLMNIQTDPSEDESYTMPADANLNGKRRWLYENEMDHLRGCLTKLQQIKNQRKSSHEFMTQQTQEIRKKTQPIVVAPSVASETNLVLVTSSSPAKQERAAVTQQVSDIKRQVLIRQDSQGSKDQQSGLQSQAKSLWSLVSDRKGPDAYNKGFKPMNSWEGDSKLRDQEKMLSDTYDQTMEVKKKVSGLPCRIVAFLLNNNIEGQLSVFNSNEIFKFTMTPLQNKDWVSKVDLSEEIERINFDYEMVDKKEYMYKLNISKKRIVPDDVVNINHIVSIQGSINPMNSVTILPLDSTMEIQFHVQIWQMKPSKNPVVFVPKASTITQTFDLNDLLPFLEIMKICGCDHLDNEVKDEDDNFLPSFYRISDYARIIQEHMCFIINESRQLMLMLKSEAINYHSTQIKPSMMAKYYNIIKKTQDSMMRSSLRNSIKTQGDQPFSKQVNTPPTIMNTKQDGELSGLPTPFLHQNDDKSSKLRTESNKDSRKNKSLIDGDANRFKIMSEPIIEGKAGPQDPILVLIEYEEEDKIEPNDIKELNMELLHQQKINQQSKHTGVSLSARRIQDNNNLEVNDQEQLQVQGQLNMLISGSNTVSPIGNKVTEQHLFAHVSKKKGAPKRSASYVNANYSMPEATLQGLQILNTQQNVIKETEADGDQDYTVREEKRPPQMDYKTFEKWQKLKEQFNEDAEDSTTKVDDDIEEYEHLYGVKLAKSHKRFTQIQLLRRTNILFDKEKAETQKEVIYSIIQEQKANPIFKKTRQNSYAMNQKKIKYYRQPKIYQNGYIKDIINKGYMIDFIKQPDPEDKNQMIMLMFYKELNQMTLLIGREEVEIINSGESMIMSLVQDAIQFGSRLKKSQQEENISHISSDDLHPDEKDDDSPFVLKIILDAGFLGRLGDANLVEPTEVIGPPNKINELMENKKFQDIIRIEIFNMFYRTKNQTNLITGQSPNLSQRNAQNEHGQTGSGNKLSDSDMEDQVKQNLYEIINEESNSDSSNGESKIRISNSDSKSVVLESSVEGEVHQNESSTILDPNKIQEILKVNKYETAQLPVVDDFKNKSALTNLGYSTKQISSNFQVGGDQAQQQLNLISKEGETEVIIYQSNTKVTLPLSSSTNKQITFNKSHSKSSKQEQMVSAKQIQSQSPMTTQKREQRTSIIFRMKSNTFESDIDFDLEMDRHIKCFSLLLNRIN